MSTKNEPAAARRRQWIREPFSGVSHLVGAGLSVAGLVVLLELARGRPWHVVSFAVYGSSLICLYLASGVYHSACASPEWLDRLKRVDHMAIYVLIAGSYVPLCLLSLRDGWGWSLLGAACGLAVLGILSTVFWRGAPEWVRVVLYIFMGWLAVFVIVPIHRALPPAAFTWLVVGGVTYTLGAVIYALDKPHLWPGKFSAHDLWHLFVMGGSLCHFLMVLQIARGPA